MMRESDKIRILFLHSHLDIGGAEKLRSLTVKYLDKTKYNIRICCIERKGRIGEQIERMGFRVDCFNKSSKPYNFFTTLSLYLYLKKNKFDIVQTSLFNTNFHGRLAAFFARVSVVISEEHSEHYFYVSLKQSPYILMDKALSLITDCIICCSKKILYSIREKEKISLKKLFLLRNCIDPAELVSRRTKEDVLMELGLTDSDIIIGNVASISLKKGHKYLLMAFSKVLDAYPDARLFIVGGGVEGLKKELIKMAEDMNILKQVYFLGEREDIADLLKVFNIFVLSSIKEGLPIALLEAMYLEIPAVATNVGGISEIVDDGKTGILVPPMDVDRLSKSIIDLIADKKKRYRIASKAKEEFKDYFSPQRYVKEIEVLHDRLLLKNRTIKK